MTARWSSWKGNGVPDDDSVVADQDLLDQQSDHALTLDYVESFGRRAQTGEKRGQRFSETQIGGAVGRLVCDRLQLGAGRVGARCSFADERDRAEAHLRDALSDRCGVRPPAG